MQSVEVRAATLLLICLQEEAEWNELLQGGTTEDGNAAADGAEAATPAEAAAAAAGTEGDAVAAEAAAAADGELPSGQKGAGSGEAPAEQTGERATHTFKPVAHCCVICSLVCKFCPACAGTQ